MNKNVKNLIGLAAGILLSVLFLLMPTEIYEAVKYFDGGYSNELYNYGVYSMFALIVVGVSWIVSAVYYYVINSVKFDRWQHWLIMLVMNVLIATMACVAYNDSIFSENNLDYGHEEIQMAMCHVLFSVIMFLVATFSIRPWSSNCRHSPF